MQTNIASNHKRSSNDPTSSPSKKREQEHKRPHPDGPEPGSPPENPRTGGDEERNPRDSLVGCKRPCSEPESSVLELYTLASKAAVNFSQFEGKDLQQLKKILVDETPYFHKHCKKGASDLRLGNFRQDNGHITFDACLGECFFHSIEVKPTSNEASHLLFSIW